MLVRRRITAVVAAVCILALTLCGCGRNEPVQRSGFYFDTYITITVYDAPDEEAALNSAFALCERYDKLFSAHCSDSDVCRINDAGGEAVSVSSETAELVALGVKYAELSGGVFDISCGRVTELWDFNSENPSVPDSAELAEACATVDYSKIACDTAASMVSVPAGTKLDLGGIAKGYIADRIAESLRKSGCCGAVINLGGNVMTVGDKDGEPFRVGVQSPFSEEEYIKILTLSDCSAVTAGSYQRCFELDGIAYHHILDLTDGMPAENGLASVTVVTESSADGDALATICFLLGEEKAAALLESCGTADSAVFVRTDGSISEWNKSSGTLQ